MSPILQEGPVRHGVIHFSERFPLVRTACGRARGPAAGLWRYVDCIACLEAGPADERIRERLRLVRQEEAARAGPVLP